MRHLKIYLSVITICLLLISWKSIRLKFNSNYCKTHKSLKYITDPVILHNLIFINDTVNGCSEYLERYKGSDPSWIDFFYKEYKTDFWKYKESKFYILDTIKIGHDKGILILRKYNCLTSQGYDCEKKNSTLYLLVIDRNKRTKKTFIVAKDMFNRLPSKELEHIESTLTYGNELKIYKKYENWLEIRNPPYIMDSIVFRFDLNNYRTLKIDTVKSIKQIE